MSDHNEFRDDFVMMTHQIRETFDRHGLRCEGIRVQLPADVYRALISDLPRYFINWSPSGPPARPLSFSHAFQFNGISFEPLPNAPVAAEREGTKL